MAASIITNNATTINSNTPNKTPVVAEARSKAHITDNTKTTIDKTANKINLIISKSTFKTPIEPFSLFV